MNNLHARAIEASERFLTRRGYDVLATSWEDADGIGTIDLVAKSEEDGIVFVAVSARADLEGFPENGVTRDVREVLAAKWLAQNAADKDVSVRFDSIAMMVVGPDRALLRHHINCLSAAEPEA